MNYSEFAYNSLKHKEKLILIEQILSKSELDYHTSLDIKKIDQLTISTIIVWDNDQSNTQRLRLPHYLLPMMRISHA